MIHTHFVIFFSPSLHIHFVFGINKRVIRRLDQITAHKINKSNPAMDHNNKDMAFAGP